MGCVNKELLPAGEVGGVSTRREMFFEVFEGVGGPTLPEAGTVAVRVALEGKGAANGIVDGSRFGFSICCYRDSKSGVYNLTIFVINFMRHRPLRLGR